MMRVERTDNPAKDLIDPSAAAWRDLASEKVSLSPVPLEAQPNEYIRASRADRPYGKTAEASASVLGNGDRLFVRLEWQDDEQPNTEFGDSAAILTGKGKTIETLGSDAEPLNMWCWSSDRPAGQSLISKGPGVVEKNADVEVSTAANLGDGRWSVVLSGPIDQVADNRIGIAIWNGSNEERAGLAAVSGWLSLDME
jgi:DMSO reductase family type II enzyme heme b subunit